MSATGRGAERQATDFYPTPAWLTRAILSHLGDTRPQGVLEPALGQGAIVEVLREKWPYLNVDWFEITMDRDFLAAPPKPKYDLVITNPPYAHAMEFVKRSLGWVKPGGLVIMLLRLGFLGSQQRARWLRENRPAVYVTPRRPSFTGGATDSAEYAWFIWGQPPQIHILETESEDSSPNQLDLLETIA